MLCHITVLPQKQNIEVAAGACLPDGCGFAYHRGKKAITYTACMLF